MNEYEEISIHMSKCYVKLIQDNLLFSINSAKANKVNNLVLKKLLNIYGTLELLNQDLLNTLSKSKYKINYQDNMFSLIKEHIHSYSDIKSKNDFFIFADEYLVEMMGKTVADSLNESKKIKANSKRKITILLKEALNDR